VEAAPNLKAQLDRLKRAIAAWYCDRGYLASSVIADILAEGGEVICKPWCRETRTASPKQTS
jgi:hypothetical protein